MLGGQPDDRAQTVNHRSRKIFGPKIMRDIFSRSNDKLSYARSG